MYTCMHTCTFDHILIVLSDSESQALVPPLEAEVRHVMEEGVRSVWSVFLER